MQIVYKLFYFCAIFLGLQVFACPKDGMYLGLGGGASFDSGKITATNTENGFQIQRSPSDTNGVANVFLGYGHTFCNCFFLGFEGGTYFPRRSLVINRPGVALTTFNFRDRFRVQDYFAGDVLPGFRICSNLLLYARGGFTVANLRLIQDANPAAAVPRFENRETKVGGRIGAGVHYSFARNFSLGLDYFYTSYPKIQTNITGFDTRVGANMHSNYIGIALTYSFPICCCD